MRVDDVDRSSEVTTAFAIFEYDPKIGVQHEDGTLAATIVYSLECGDKTAQAIRAKAWGILQTLTPAALRVKDPAKVRAARKGKAKQATQEATTSPTLPEAGPEAHPGPDGTVWPAEAPRGDQGDVSDQAADV